MARDCRAQINVADMSWDQIRTLVREQDSQVASKASSSLTVASENDKPKDFL